MHKQRQLFLMWQIQSKKYLCFSFVAMLIATRGFISATNLAIVSKYYIHMFPLNPNSLGLNTMSEDDLHRFHRKRFQHNIGTNCRNALWSIVQYRRHVSWWLIKVYRSWAWQHLIAQSTLHWITNRKENNNTIPKY